jgi:hypothetical protein
MSGLEVFKALRVALPICAVCWAVLYAVFLI